MFPAWGDQEAPFQSLYWYVQPWELLALFVTHDAQPKIHPFCEHLQREYDHEMEGEKNKNKSNKIGDDGRIDKTRANKHLGWLVEENTKKKNEKIF